MGIPRRIQRLALTALLAAWACGDGPTDGFTTVDRDSHAVVEATVVDQAWVPVPSATLWAIPDATSCQVETAGTVGSEQATTDTKGFVRFGLAAGLWGPGVYCVAFVVRQAGQEAADTLTGYPVPFFHTTPPADTVRVTLITPR